jgi:aminoglycoside phosphotransferase (APT) family kinase protein
MKTSVATSSRASPEARDPEAKTAEMAIDDLTMRDRLTEYLSTEAGDAVQIEAFERRSPGFSWITYSFTARDRSDRRRKLILRVGPTNGLFAPYSVLPQVYALQSLENSRVPAPRLVSYSQEGTKIGFPFFICEHVSGDVAAPWLGSGATEEHRRRIVVQFLDILAELHTIDW